MLRPGLCGSILLTGLINPVLVCCLRVMFLNTGRSFTSMVGKPLITRGTGLPYGKS